MIIKLFELFFPPHILVPIKLEMALLQHLLKQIEKNFVKCIITCYYGIAFQITLNGKLEFPDCCLLPLYMDSVGPVLSFQWKVIENIFFSDTGNSFFIFIFIIKRYYFTSVVVSSFLKMFPNNYISSAIYNVTVFLTWCRYIEF